MLKVKILQLNQEYFQTPVKITLFKNNVCYKKDARMTEHQKSVCDNMP